MDVASNGHPNPEFKVCAAKSVTQCVCCRQVKSANTVRRKANLEAVSAINMSSRLQIASDVGVGKARFGFFLRV